MHHVEKCGPVVTSNVRVGRSRQLVNSPIRRESSHMLTFLVPRETYDGERTQSTFQALTVPGG